MVKHFTKKFTDCQQEKLPELDNFAGCRYIALKSPD
jgi:hypothetical protein